MTVQRKTIAKGTKISIGPVGGTLEEFGRISSFTPPTEDFETVEAPELNPQDDAGNDLDADPLELGDEVFGEFDFETYWDPQHADATQLDTWRSGKTHLTFQLDTPHATGGARLTFNGKIKTLAPAQLVKTDYFKRTVTVVRTSVVTNAAKPSS